MINSVSGALPPAFAATTQKNSLNAEQKELISETLKKYDVGNLTAEDAQAIVATFSAAGIRPSQELAAAIASEGFDARAIGDRAGVRPGGPPPGPQPEAASQEINFRELVSYLEDLLSQFGDVNLSDDDKESVYTDLRTRFGLEEGESIINITV